MSARVPNHGRKRPSPSHEDRRIAGEDVTDRGCDAASGGAFDPATRLVIRWTT